MPGLVASAAVYENLIKRTDRRTNAQKTDDRLISETISAHMMS